MHSFRICRSVFGSALWSEKFFFRPAFCGFRRHNAGGDFAGGQNQPQFRKKGNGYEKQNENHRQPNGDRNYLYCPRSRYHIRDCTSCQPLHGQKSGSGTGKTECGARTSDYRGRCGACQGGSLEPVGQNGEKQKNMSSASTPRPTFTPGRS